MENIEELKQQTVQSVYAAARKEAIQDGFDNFVADYVAAKVSDAYDVGWKSALVNTVNLLKLQ